MQATVTVLKILGINETDGIENEGEDREEKGEEDRKTVSMMIEVTE